MFGKEANATVSRYVDERKVVASMVSAGVLARFARHVMIPRFARHVMIPRFARGPPKG